MTRPYDDLSADEYEDTFNCESMLFDDPYELIAELEEEVDCPLIHLTYKKEPPV